MKWKPPFAFRTTYKAEHVNVLRRMVARHYPHPHRFVCITDDAKGIDPGVEVIPVWDDYADIPPPQGGYNPSCYRRLRLFSREMEGFWGGGSCRSISIVRSTRTSPRCGIAPRTS